MTALQDIQAELAELRAFWTAIRVRRPGDVYPDDAFVFWGFGSEGLRRLAERAGFAAFEPHAAPIIDGHPRIIASLADRAAANNEHR
jgi:hypothetical protein